MRETDPNDPKKITHVDLWYPSLAGEVDHPTCTDVVDIALIDVRAARDIRVHYDYARDGYVISARTDNPDVLTESKPFAEKAFIPAWEDHDDPLPTGGRDSTTG